MFYEHPYARLGIAATELAILLPLIILLCLAAVDLARYARTAIALEGAVRVGAEYGAGRRVTPNTHDIWEGLVEDKVHSDFGDDQGLDSLQVSVAISSFAEDLPRIEVKGECTFKTVIHWWMMPETFVIRRQSSLQRFRK